MTYMICHCIEEDCPMPVHEAPLYLPPGHPLTDNCPDPECSTCAERDCPHNEPLHYHHDGCPSCDVRVIIPPKIGDAQGFCTTLDPWS